MKIRYAVIGIATSLICNFAESARAERLVQSLTEYRTAIFFKAGDAVVQSLLPPDWKVVPATGHFSGANFIVVLIDGVAAENPDKKSVPNQSKTAVVIVPANNEQTGSAGAVVLMSFALRAEDVPGAYSITAPAKIDMAKSDRGRAPGEA